MPAFNHFKAKIGRMAEGLLERGKEKIKNFAFYHPPRVTFDHILLLTLSSICKLFHVTELLIKKKRGTDCEKTNRQIERC
jgi:hypothetical protein